MQRSEGLLVDESELQQQGLAAAWCLGRRPPGSAARLSRRGVYAGGACELYKANCCLASGIPDVVSIAAGIHDV